MIGGLNPSYHTFVTTFNYGNRDVQVSFEDFQTELLNYEQLLEAHQKPLQPDGGQFAFHLHKQKTQPFQHRKYRSPQYGRNSSRQPLHHQPTAPPHHSAPPPPKFTASLHYGKPLNSSTPLFPNSRPACQICGKISHQALDCYHRMDFSFQGKHPPAQLVAMAAYSPDTTEVESPGT
jgi:hypothetical protein